METRRFDNLGVDASLLGFGCMRFPMKDGKIDETEAEKIMDRLADDDDWPKWDGS